MSDLQAKSTILSEIKPKVAETGQLLFDSPADDAQNIISFEQFAKQYAVAKSITNLNLGHPDNLRLVQNAYKDYLLQANTIIDNNNQFIKASQSPISDSHYQRTIQQAETISEQEQYARYVETQQKNKGIETEESRKASTIALARQLMPKIEIVYNEVTVRADVEIERLAMALYHGAESRLWNIARTIGYITKVIDDKETVVGGRNNISRKELKSALKEQFGITYHPEHFRRLIRQGHGIFWNKTRTHIFIRSRKHVASCLIKEADEQGLQAVYTNPQGTTDMLIPASGDIERWYAHVYAAWHAHRSNRKLSRVSRHMLKDLFNRTDEQLRNYENEHLSSVLEVIPTYMQTKNAHLIGDGFTETITTKGDPLYMKRWSNTYRSKIRQHDSYGQARKTRRKVNTVYSDISSVGTNAITPSKRDGRFNCRILKLYFERDGYNANDIMNQAAKHLDKHSAELPEVYIGLGQNKQGHYIIEPTADGGADTHRNSRASFKDEWRHLNNNPNISQSNQNRYDYAS